MAKGRSFEVRIDRKRKKTVDVQVSNRVLRVDIESYPLANIARIIVGKSGPDHLAAAWRALRAALVVAALVFLATRLGDSDSGDGSSGSDDSGIGSGNDSDNLRGILLLTFAVAFVYFLVEIAQQTRYVVVIETNGPPATVIASKDQSLIEHLGAQIIATIDDPSKEFRYTIENYHVGDNIKILGGESVIGKVGG